MALGAGVVASLAASQMFPTFHDVPRLRELSGRPVLGIVTLLASPRSSERSAGGRLLFAGGVGGPCSPLYGVAIASAGLQAASRRSGRMSLIEQAAKRLEELRTRGVDVPDERAIDDRRRSR